ncbi:MAG: Hsp20/alpha crystallin family protein [Lachnospiraceae bacterium]|nr:Hsp20/alpha crystallin family protein [Lachnospiraceae bacterium]
MARIYANNMWDDFFDDFFHEPAHHAEPSRGQEAMMRTDVKETEEVYELTMDLPGVKKEDIKAELKEGYLTIQATSNLANGKYIRRERFTGTCSRTFYVGKGLKQEDIRARFENGTLILTVPKNVKRPEAEEKKYITIE